VAYQGFTNDSPFAAEHFLLADEAGADLLVVVAKATYRIDGADTLVLEDEQAPILLANEHSGEPDTSSLRRAAEIDPMKPGTDIALIGHAHAPGGKPTTALDVKLQIGTIERAVRVFGDRHWSAPEGLVRKTRRLSSPDPFVSMPLDYEHAFGGGDDSSDDPSDHEFESCNPVGRGLIARKSSLTGPVPLPNLEDPADLIESPEDRPMPVCFGFVAPHWEWRARHAGTYDSAWERERMPLLPRDFDRRFFHAAHPGLISPEYLQGNETIDVEGASPRGHLALQLPGNTPEAVVAMRTGAPNVLKLNLDTLVIDTDAHHVSIVWRGGQDVHRKIYELESVKVRMAQGDMDARAA
jgi:hypothetical protein